MDGESRKRIVEFQKRREKRLKERGLVLEKNKFDFFRSDADEESQNNEAESSGGHGNTKLPFGLCKRYGIEVGADWTPKDAWDALAGKGITPEGAYSHLKKGEDPGEPDIDKLLSGGSETVSEEETAKGESAAIEKPKKKTVTFGDHEYEIEAKRGGEDGFGFKTVVLTGEAVGGGTDMKKMFPSKEELYRYLKAEGVEEFPDPETGEIVNPSEMEFAPKKTWFGEGTRSAEYGDVKGSKRSYGKEKWELMSRKIPGTEMKVGYVSTWPTETFKTKEDMLYALKERGIEEFVDPETGETVNPVEMDLPERDLVLGGVGYKDLAIGMRGGQYAVTGSLLDGKKVTIRAFDTLKEAKAFLDEWDVDEDKVKISPALKKREAERVSWLSSDKTEYVTADDGTRYGDLVAEKDGYGGSWMLTGEDENGEKKSWRFYSKGEMMKFMKDQGCEKVRIGKEKVNPVEYEVPPVVATIKGHDYQEVGLKVIYDDPYLYGIDLDGEEKVIRSIPYSWTAQKFLDSLQEEFGLGEGSLTISDEDKEKLKKRKEAEAEKERRRKEFETKAVEIRGRRVADPFIEKDSDGDICLSGYDEDGDVRRLTGWSKSWKRIDRAMAAAGLDVRSILPEDMKEDYEKFVERMKRIETEGIDFGGYRVVDPYMFLDTDGTWAIRGYDDDGDVTTVTSWGGIADTIDEAQKHGITDIEGLFKGEKEKEAYEKYKVAAEKFDKEAVTIGDRKYLDPYVYRDTDGTYQLRGTTRSGDTRSISSWGDLYDLEEFASKRGVNLEDFVKDDKVKEEFAKYKKARESFDKDAIDVAGTKYVDLTVEFNPRYKEWTIKGRDAKGREQEIVKTSDWQGMRSELERYGLKEESFSLSDDAKKQKERAEKAKELLDTGEWYSMGGRDTAFTDLRVEKAQDTGDWLVIGKDMDGKERTIGDAKSTWDDAISEMEDKGVRDYKVKDGDKELGKPKWGMHRVMLMRKPEGGYVVFADSKKFGDHAVMYEDPKEENARAWLENNGIPSGSVKTRGMNPNDDKPRTHTAKSLEGFDKHRAERVEQIGMLRDMSDSDKKDAAEMLTDMFQQGAYRMRRKGHFEDIFDSRFKSLLETGTSGGSTFKDGRRRTGEESFGHDYDIKPKDAEKYGYLGVEDDTEAVDSDIASWYGSTVYKFKKDKVGDRATYSFGDTLDAGRPLVGYAGEYPTIEGLSGLDHWGDGKDNLEEVMKDYRRYKRGDMSYSEFLHAVSGRCRDGYIETHYHGDLTLADVESITFPKRGSGDRDGIDTTFGKMSPEKRKKVVDFLKANNVKLQYYDKDSHGKTQIHDGYQYLQEKYGGL